MVITFIFFVMRHTTNLSYSKIRWHHLLDLLLTKLLLSRYDHTVINRARQYLFSAKFFFLKISLYFSRVLVQTVQSTFPEVHGPPFQVSHFFLHLSLPQILLNSFLFNSYLNQLFQFHISS